MITSEDLKSCYCELLKLQKACGCDSMNVGRIGCRHNRECDFYDGQCYVNALKQIILDIEVKRAKQKFVEEMEGSEE